MRSWPSNHDIERERSGLPGAQVGPTSRREYSSMLARMIDGLPWLGTPPFELSLSGRSARGRVGTDGLSLRVLVSMLVGRPMSDVARRANCSVRTVYNVLNQVVFKPDTYTPMEEWARLGLLAVIDGPKMPYRFPQRGRRREREEDRLPVVCLVCHRPVGRLEHLLSRPQHDGSLILPGDDSWSQQIGVSYIGQGHLVCHFALGDDPIPMIVRPAWQLMVKLGRRPDLIEYARRVDLADAHRSHWTEGVAEEEYTVYERWRASGSPVLTPMEKRKEMRIEQAERFWLDILDEREVRTR